MLRMIPAAIAVLILLNAFEDVAITGGTAEAERIRWAAAQAFGTTFSLHLLMIAFLGPLLSIESIHRERREQTLGLIYLSRLRIPEFLFGKWTAISALLLMISVALGPIYVLISWLGGLDSQWLPTAAMLIVVFILFCSAAGLAFASIFRGTIAAGLAYGGAFFFVFLAEVSPNSGFWRFFGTPIRAVALALDQNPGTLPELWTILAALFAAAICLVLFAGWILPQTSPLSHQETSWFSSNMAAIGRSDASEEDDEEHIEGNPVAWLESRGGPFRPGRLLLFGNALATAALIFGLMMHALGNSAAAEFVQFIGAAGLFLYPAVILGARVWQGEQKRRTFSTLLSTPLTAQDLVLGKLRAAAPVYGFLGVAFLMIFVPGLIDRRMTSEEFITFAAKVLFVQLLLYCLAMMFSLIYSNTLLAVLVSLGVAAGLFFFKLMAFSYFGIDFFLGEPIAAADLAYPLLCTALVVFVMIRQFDERTGRST